MLCIIWLLFNIDGKITQEAYTVQQCSMFLITRVKKNNKSSSCMAIIRKVLLVVHSVRIIMLCRVLQWKGPLFSITITLGPKPTENRNRSIVIIIPSYILNKVCSNIHTALLGRLDIYNMYSFDHYWSTYDTLGDVWKANNNLQWKKNSSCAWASDYFDLFVVWCT